MTFTLSLRFLYIFDQSGLLCATPSTKMEWVATLGKAGWKHLGNFTGLVKIFSHELKYLSPNIIKSTYLGYLRQVFGLNRSEKSC